MKWVKRIVGAGMALVVLTVVAIVGWGWWLHRPVPEGVPGPEADAAAKALIDSVGGLDAWSATGAVRWTHAGRNTHLWDRGRHLYRLERGGEVVLMDLDSRAGRAWDDGVEQLGAAQQAALDAAWEVFCNDSFWLNPVVKAFDDGTTRSLVPLDDGRKGVLVQYASGGVTPGDAYLWIPGDDGRPAAWRMWVQVLPVGGLEVTWGDWETLPSGAQIATAHRWTQIGLDRPRITDLAAGRTWADIVDGQDPFEPLGVEDVAPSAPHGEHAHPGRHEMAAGAQHRFDDAEKWAKVFDDPERDAWQKPRELVAALDITPGSTVADLGAGTGYLVAHLIDAVGPDGRVLALDVEADLVRHMKERFAAQPNVDVRHIGYEDAGLSDASVDLIVLVDVYHHIQDRTAYFTRVRPALRPGGRLVVVDFVMDEIPVGPPPGHRIAASQVTEELSAAGFERAGALDLLPYQYVEVYTVAE